VEIVRGDREYYLPGGSADDAPVKSSRAEAHSRRLLQSARRRERVNGTSQASECYERTEEGGRRERQIAVKGKGTYNREKVKCFDTTFDPETSAITRDNMLQLDRVSLSCFTTSFEAIDEFMGWIDSWTFIVSHSRIFFIANYICYNSSYCASAMQAAASVRVCVFVCLSVRAKTDKLLIKNCCDLLRIRATCSAKIELISYFENCR